MADAKRPNPAVPHNITLQERTKLTVTGVAGVDNFDDTTITASLFQGGIQIRGRGLHINRMSVETGELLVEGTVQAIIYTDSSPREHAGFFGKLFR